MVNKRLKWRKPKKFQASMAYVYAGPERMEDAGREDAPPMMYPYHYLSEKEDAVEMEIMMREVYGPPERIRAELGSIEKYSRDMKENPDETGQLCMTCGKYFPAGARFCPFCGSSARVAAEQYETPMACVYAGPPVRKSLFAKLFKRKK